MRRHNLSVAGLLWIVGVVGIWLISLRSASSYWTATATIMTLLACLTALLGAILLRGTARAFCCGFVVFAGGLCLELRLNLFEGDLRTNLVKTLTEIAEKVIPPPPGQLAVLSSAPFYSSPAPPYSVPAPPIAVAAPAPAGYGAALASAPEPIDPSAGPVLTAPAPPWTPIPSLGVPPALASPPSVSPLPPEEAEQLRKAIADQAAEIDRQERVIHFGQIGLLSLTVLIGLIGGVIAVTMTTRSPSPLPPSAAGPAGG